MKTPNKEIAKSILKALAITGMVAGVIVFPGLAPLFKWIDGFGEKRRRSTRNSFYRLQARGMVKVREEKRGVELVLTEKGRRQVARYRLIDAKVNKQLRWDGRWRIVMFDVPEAFRKYRDMVRIKLRKEGFLPVQKSVFINPYPCSDLIEVLRGYYKLQPGQLYLFEARVLEDEKILKKHFKI